MQMRGGYRAGVQCWEEPPHSWVPASPIHPLGQHRAELKCMPLFVLRRERGLTFLGTTLWAGTWQDFSHFVLKDRVITATGLELKILGLVTIISTEGKRKTVTSL